MLTQTMSYMAGQPAAVIRKEYKMKSFIFISLVIIFAIAVLTFESAYKVDDTCYAIITRAGKTIKVVNNAGWHFKIPFLQQVQLVPNTSVLKEDSLAPKINDKNTIDLQSNTQNESHEDKPRKIVQIKPVDLSALNCPTRIVDGVEQVIMQPGMSTMQYNLCNEKIRRLTRR